MLSESNPSSKTSQTFHENFCARESRSDSGLGEQLGYRDPLTRNFQGLIPLITTGEETAVFVLTSRPLVTSASN